MNQTQADALRIIATWATLVETIATESISDCLIKAENIEILERAGKSIMEKAIFLKGKEMKNEN